MDETAVTNQEYSVPTANTFVRPAESQWVSVVRRLVRHRLAVAGLLALLLLTLLCIFGPALSPYEWDETDVINRYAPPSRQHPMGTDSLGRDMFTRILAGGRVSLAVAFLASLTSVALGGGVGIVSGFVGGVVDDAIMRTVDVVRALPLLPILIVVSVVVGQGNILMIVVLITIFGWTGVSRIVRSVVLSLREQEFVLAARTLGATRQRIMFKHLLPNTMSPIIVAVTLQAGWAIRTESLLSYLGLGIQPPTPSWGNLLMNAQADMWTNPWLAIYPGIFIFITLLSFNFLGDGLRDALDPRRSGE
jgi:peptide/nickel transport system permease protein